MKLVATLPHHHGDPFGRLIIALAQKASLTVVGSDTVFDAYGVARMW